jgi:hypothetical protein
LVFCHFTAEGAAHLADYLSSTTTTNRLESIRLEGELYQTNGRRILSGMHHNTSVKTLILVASVLGDAWGGKQLSDLLQHNATLTTLQCGHTPLGLKGARVLRHGLGVNRTLQNLSLVNCQLGDAGLACIVEALLENHDSTTIQHLDLSQNRLTSTSLVHLTRLLLLQQQHHPLSSSLIDLRLNDNPGLFADPASSHAFCRALQNTRNLEWLHLNSCQLPGPVVLALFQLFLVNHNNNNNASSSNTGSATITTSLRVLYVYDTVRLDDDDPDLEHLLRYVIPHMRHLRSLSVHWNFTHPAVCAAFQRNSCLRYLYNQQGEPLVTANTTPMSPIVLASLQRNRRLYAAQELLDRSQPRRVRCGMPYSSGGSGLGGIWAQALARLGDDCTGATAVYKILQEKLATSWCVAASAAAAAASSQSTTSSSSKSSSSDNERQLGRKDNDDSANNKNNNSNRNADEAAQQQKRQRRL